MQRLFLLAFSLFSMIGYAQLAEQSTDEDSRKKITDLMFSFSNNSDSIRNQYMVAIEIKGWLDSTNSSNDCDTTWLIYQNKKDEVRLQADSLVTGIFVPPAARLWTQILKSKTDSGYRVGKIVRKNQSLKPLKLDDKNKIDKVQLDPFAMAILPYEANEFANEDVLSVFFASHQELVLGKPAKIPGIYIGVWQMNERALSIYFDENQGGVPIEMVHQSTGREKQKEKLDTILKDGRVQSRVKTKWLKHRSGCYLPESMQISEMGYSKGDGIIAELQVRFRWLVMDDVPNVNLKLAEQEWLPIFVDRVVDADFELLPQGAQATR